MYATMAATAARPRTHRDASSSLLAAGRASHTARMIASTRYPNSMSRAGSALRASGSDHRCAHGTAPSCLLPMVRRGPKASTTISAKPMTSSRVSLLDQVSTASASTVSSSGIPDSGMIRALRFSEFAGIALVNPAE